MISPQVGLYLDMTLRSSHIRELYRSIILFGRLRGWTLYSNKVIGTQPLGNLDQWNGDGLIAHTLGQREPLERIRRRGIPIINLSSSGGDLDLPSVWIDDEACGRLAAQHWQAKGITHFAYFGNDQLTYSRKRGTAYRDELAKNNQAVHYFGSAHDPFIGEVPSKKELEWIKQLPASIAIFCSDDMRAQYLSQQLQAIGRHIPDDALILGVGDDTMICELNNPPLSSIPYPGNMIGTHAAAALEQHWRTSQPLNHLELIQPGPINSRESTKRWPDPLIQQAMLQIHRSAGQADYNVNQLAVTLGYNRRLIERRFKDQLGQTPLEKIHQRRITIAQAYLKDTDLSIATIAQHMGFKASENFSRFFHQHSGCSPKDWRTAQQ